MLRRSFVAKLSRWVRAVMTNAGVLVHKRSRGFRRGQTRVCGDRADARAHIAAEVEATSEAPVWLFIALLLFLCGSRSSPWHPGAPGPPTP